jgi:hypothetical protein
VWCSPCFVSKTLHFLKCILTFSFIVRKFTWSTPENSIHKNGVITHGYFSLSPHNLDINFKKRYWIKILYSITCTVVNVIIHGQTNRFTHLLPIVTKKHRAVFLHTLFFNVTWLSWDRHFKWWTNRCSTNCTTKKMIYINQIMLEVKAILVIIYMYSYHC